jgi:hypothetical protein
MPFEASPPVPLSLTGEGGRLRRDLAEVEAAFFGHQVVKGPPSPVRERGTGGEASKGRAPDLGQRALKVPS